MEAIYAVIPDERVVKIEREQLDPTKLASHEILVKADTTVVSAGTELANFTALSPGVWIPGSWNAYPWRPGYGLIGKVVAVGSQEGEFYEGQRIFCFGKHASHQRYDASGEKPYTSAFPFDHDLPPTMAIMARMALIGLTAPQMTQFEAGDTVAVFGLGLVGNFAAQFYQLAGARVIGLDLVPERCEVARQVGIDTVIDVPQGEQLTVLSELTGEGVQVAVDAVGHAAVIGKCVEACAPFGQIILLGSPREALEMNITQLLRPIHHRWLALRGALEWRLPPFPTPDVKYSIAENLQMILDHIQRNEIKVEPLISHVIEPAELPEAYKGLLEEKDTYLGVVVDWTKTRL